LKNYKHQLKHIYQSNDNRYFVKDEYGTVIQTSTSQSNDVRTLAALLQIDFSLLESQNKIALDENKQTLINYCDATFNRSPIYISAKKGKYDFVELFIKLNHLT
jgi:hypothetical protein